jgi:cyclic beta-1,2-glucan synthetase
MISDDVVWLASAVARYIEVSGDESILTTEIPFIEGAALAEGQHDAFYVPDTSKETANLYEHCARALDLAVKRTAASGLPLILGGDWNDGMNRVGEEGRGDSVWLAWFLLKTINEFAPIARKTGDTARAKRWEKHAGSLKRALENAAWDGRWYRRGSFDDGTPLGSHRSDECQIDSIAQSWSVLSGEGDPARSRTAMESALELLVDPDARLIRLFTPPFSETEKDPGYIKSYPPGVREIGGQYTHAATWFVLALAQMGRADDAYRCLALINPVNHALTRSEAEKYRVEPYVVAADVYSVGSKAGQGGWTWYTGSAGWLYRAAVEGLLGIRRQADRVSIQPALPSDWPGYSATLRIGGTCYRIRVTRDPGAVAASIGVDGEWTEGSSFALREGGEVDIEVKLPGT